MPNAPLAVEPILIVLVDPVNPTVPMLIVLTVPEAIAPADKLRVCEDVDCPTVIIPVAAVPPTVIAPVVSLVAILRAPEVNPENKVAAPVAEPTNRSLPVIVRSPPTTRSPTVFTWPSSTVRPST